MDLLHKYTFTTFNDHLPGVQEARLVSAEFAVNPRGWLLLIGPCGCGKTHLAAAVANQRLESGAEVFYTTTPDLLDALRAALSSPEQYARLFSRVREVELLILEDLGAQQSSAWSNEKLSQILDVRAQKALTTVITAIPKEFQALNERLRSRLTDAQLVTIALFEHAGDFRLYKRAPVRRMPG